MIHVTKTSGQLWCKVSQTAVVLRHDEVESNNAHAVSAQSVELVLSIEDAAYGTILPHRFENSRIEYHPKPQTTPFVRYFERMYM